MTKLRQWRLARGLTLKQAAKKFRVPWPSLARYERGAKPRQARIVLRIEKVTDGFIGPRDWL